MKNLFILAVVLLSTLNSFGQDHKINNINLDANKLSIVETVDQWQNVKANLHDSRFNGYVFTKFIKHTDTTKVFDNYSLTHEFLKVRRVSDRLMHDIVVYTNDVGHQVIYYINYDKYK